MKKKEYKELQKKFLNPDGSYNLSLIKEGNNQDRKEFVNYCIRNGTEFPVEFLEGLDMDSYLCCIGFDKTIDLNGYTFVGNNLIINRISLVKRDIARRKEIFSKPPPYPHRHKLFQYYETDYKDMPDGCVLIANMKVRDNFKLSNKQIEVISITDKTITFKKEEKVERMRLMSIPPNFIRNLEAEYSSQMLQRNNPFHEDFSLIEIAKRDRVT